METSYRRVDSTFSAASNPLLSSNRNGLFANLRYRIFKPITFSIISQRYNNRLGSNFRFDSAEVEFAFQRLPTLTLYGQSSSNKYPLTIGTNTWLQDMGVRSSYSFKATNLFFEYNRPLFHFATNPILETATDRFRLGIFRLIGQRTALSFNQTLELSQQTGQTGRDTGNRNHFALVQLEHYLGQKGMSFNLGLTHQRSRFNTQVGRALWIRGGVRLPLISSGSGAVSLDYQTNLTRSGFLSSQYVGTSSIAYVRYYQYFQVGKRLHADQVVAENFRLKEQPQPEFNRLSGRIFEDKNGNQRWDQGEPGIPNVTVALENERQSQTDENGYYAIKDIYPGEHRIRLVMKTLPIELTPLTPTEVTLPIPKSGSVAVDFAIIRTGRIKGMVFWDENRNGKWDDGERKLVDVPVKVEGSEILNFTDEQGNFILDGLPLYHLKPWKIMVDMEMLGEDYEAIDDGLAVLDVSSNTSSEVNFIALGIAAKERPIIKTFEKEDTWR